MRQGLTYADVLIVPQYSDIDTRDDIDIVSHYLGAWRKPFISAPMDYVTGNDMAQAMYNTGSYGIISRFGNVDFKEPQESLQFFDYGVSVGVREPDKAIEWLREHPSHSICIDVAHGHHENVLDMISVLKVEFPYSFIIAGNVATKQGFRALARVGVDAVRVGIGPGSACSTRENTGIGVPQLTAVMDVTEAKREERWSVSIIADGGIQTPGDIAKALAAGADAVMLGKMLAGHKENPGHIPNDEYGSVVKQPYQGQSLLGSNGARNAPEGISGWVDTKGSVVDTIHQLTNYLKSSFSYVGARNISEFRDFAEFIQVSPGTFKESETRL